MTDSLSDSLFLRACRREPVERPPVWMMRQAGRYLPEYRAVRQRSDFLTMVRTPELAVEVTLQPVDLIGVDAAIIFSDILVVPQAMGMALTVDEGVGPRFDAPLRAPEDFERLKDIVPERDLGYVLEAIRMARKELEGREEGSGRVPLIGFAGAPWTLMSYMVEGGGTKAFSLAKGFLAQDPDRAHALLDRLATAVGQFLKVQVRAGAQAVQLFDSWASALAPSDFREFALPYLAKAVAIAREAGAPVIAFAPGAGWALEEIAEATGAEVIGVDWQVEPHAARKRLLDSGVAIQGNLDPAWLYAPPGVIRQRTWAMLSAFGGRGHIANLGHGILPNVPVEHAKAFVDAVKAWRSPS